MTFGSLPGSGGGSLRRKEPSHGMRTGGTRDQLVPLANGIRVVDGDRHRQHDLFFAAGHASSNSLGDQLGRSRLGRAFCPNLGMRQYWRDFDAFEAWARSTPHREWWRDFLRASRGTGFWHEAYFMRGGMEAVYDDVPVLLGFGQFAPTQPARGPMFSARTRAKLAGEPRPAVVEEAELYGVSPQ